MITFLVLSQNNKVITIVGLVLLIGHLVARHIHLASENRLELGIIRQFAVHFLHVIEKFLDPEHVSVIGKRDSMHSVGNRLVYKFRNRSLAVKQTVLRMYMKMCELCLTHGLNFQITKIIIVAALC